MSTARRKRKPKAPSEAQIRKLVKKELGPNGLVDFYYDARLWARNEEDVSINIELESVSKEEVRRLIVPVLQAIGRHRRGE